MEHTGWVKIDRGILDWEYWDDISTRNVFLTCILRANYEATKWKGIDVEVGSMLTTLDGLAKMTGLTTQQTRTALKKLTSTVDCNGDPRTPELTIKTTNKYTIVTITKYALYQGIDKDTYNASNINCNNQLTNKKEIPPTPPIKNIKEGEEIKDIISLSISYNNIKKIWNEKCAMLTTVTSITVKRREKIKARFKEFATVGEPMAVYTTLLDKISQSKWMTEQSRENWRKGVFDWLFANSENWVKVWEGKYNTQTTGTLFDTPANNIQYEYDQYGNKTKKQGWQ